MSVVNNRNFGYLALPLAVIGLVTNLINLFIHRQSLRPVDKKFVGAVYVRIEHAVLAATVIFKLKGIPLRNALQDHHVGFIKF